MSALGPPPLALDAGTHHCGARAVVDADHAGVPHRTRPRGPGEVGVQRVLSSARQGSLDQLAVAFGGFRFESVLQHADGTSPVLLVVPPATQAHLDVRAGLDRLLVHHDLPFPRMSWASGGRPGHHEVGGTTTVPSSPYAASLGRPGGIQAGIRDGHTLVVNQVDQYLPAVSQLSEHLERAFGTKVGVNAYLGTESSEGFGAHWDTHDVVILQVGGRKYWEVMAPVALSLTEGVAAPSDTSGTVVWSGILEPGSALFIPRGWGHRTTGLGELSTHLTFGIRRVSGLEAIDVLARRVSDGAEPAPLELAGVRARVLDAFDRTGLEHVQGTWRAMAPARARGRLSDLFAWEGGAGSSSYVPVARFGPLPAFLDDPSGDRVAVATGGLALSVPADHAEVFALLFDEAAPAAAWYRPCPAGSTDCYRSLAATFVAFGAAEVRSAAGGTDG